jgi:hypothetical protein
VLASNGILYGTTSSGSQGLDTFFKITPGGTLTTLAQFGLGIGAVSTLIQANNGNLYGTTQGAINPGTVYGITSGGTVTMQHNFCQIKNCLDGANPAASLVQGANGFLYGTTEFGGLDTGLCSEDSCGTIFEVGFLSLSASRAALVGPEHQDAGPPPRVNSRNIPITLIDQGRPFSISVKARFRHQSTWALRFGLKRGTDIRPKL